MDTWIYIVSILASILLGVKMKSRCFTRNCECSIEKSETDENVLRSIRIGRKSKIPRDNDMDRSVHNETIS